MDEPRWFDSAVDLAGGGMDYVGPVARSLDPSIRSAARAVDGGRVEIVINSRYPLYRRRAGDLEYMLETGLLEQLKPGPGEEMTIDEYHEQLVDALSLALGELSGAQPGRHPTPEVVRAMAPGGSEAPCKATCFRGRGKHRSRHRVAHFARFARLRVARDVHSRLRFRRGERASGPWYIRR
jgi:hypothetical protein